MISFISEHPEVELRTAAIAAIAFSHEHNIPFNPTLQFFNKPIITVIKKEGTWYPVALEPENITFITGIDSHSFGGSLDQATNIGKILALSQGTDFDQSIGMSINLSNNGNR